MRTSDIPTEALPRDLTPEQWSALWQVLESRR